MTGRSGKSVLVICRGCGRELSGEPRGPVGGYQIVRHHRPADNVGRKQWCNGHLHVDHRPVEAAVES